MPVAEGRKYLTLAEASQQFGVPIPTLRVWLMRGDLRKYRRGDGRVIVEEEQVREEVERRRRIEPAE